MTHEEKELLLKDLCARLPYGVIVAYKSRGSEGRVSLGYGNIGYVNELGRGWWTDCKPYLRPMSSMTDDEKTELFQLMGNGTDIQRIDFYNSHYFDYRCLIDKSLALEAPEGMYNIKE